MRISNRTFTIDRSINPPSCLPDNAGMLDLLDITPVGAPWRVYMDAGSGEVFDGAVFAKIIEEQRHG